MKHSVTLKTVILTFYYEYEFIITHTSSFCKSNISAPHVKLSNQRKVPKNPLNIGIALSLFISCGPAPKVQLTCGTIPHVPCVMGADLCKTQKGEKVKIKSGF